MAPADRKRWLRWSGCGVVILAAASVIGTCLSSSFDGAAGASYVAHVQIVTPAGSVPTLGGVEQAIRDSDQEEDLRVIRRIVRAAREACHLTADG